MTLYSYRAISLLGQLTTGRCEAQSPQQLQKMLKKKRINIISYRQVRKLLFTPSPKFSLDDLNSVVTR